jgi:hypothetical protein
MTQPETAAQAIFQAKCDLFREKYERGNIRDMVDFFYASHAVLEGSGLLPQVGRKAIQTIYEEIRHSCRSIRIQLDPVVVTAELAYGCQTNINLRNDGESEIHRGLMIWRLIEGEWFVIHDFFFADVNPDPAASVLDSEFVTYLLPGG